MKLSHRTLGIFLLLVIGACRDSTVPLPDTVVLAPHFVGANVKVGFLLRIDKRDGTKYRRLHLKLPPSFGESKGKLAGRAVMIAGKGSAGGWLIKETDFSHANNLAFSFAILRRFRKVAHSNEQYALPIRCGAWNGYVAVQRQAGGVASDIAYNLWKDNQLLVLSVLSDVAPDSIKAESDILAAAVVAAIDKEKGEPDIVMVKPGKG